MGRTVAKHAATKVLLSRLFLKRLVEAKLFAQVICELVHISGLLLLFTSFLQKILHPTMGFFKRTFDVIITYLELMLWRRRRSRSRGNLSLPLRAFCFPSYFCWW